MSLATFDGPGVGETATDESRLTTLEASPWEALQKAMRRPLPTEHRAISPLGRPEVEVRLRTNVDLDELTEWRKGARDPDFDGGFNPLRLACILLANASTDILIEGTSTGMTLASPGVREMYPDAVDEVEAVRHFFGKEDIWLTARVLPSLTAAFAGGEDGETPLRPTSAGPSTS